MDKGPAVIEVAVPVSVSSTFSYLAPEGVPPEEIIGRRVLVDFRGRKLRGYAVGKGTFSEKYRIKSITKVIDKRPVLKNGMLGFAEWIAGYYFAGLGEVLSLMVPKGIKPSPPEALPDNTAIPAQENAVLTPAQDEVYRSIKNDIAAGQNKFYLYGVTGSGKTEIYIRLIEDTINQGRSVIFLVPEIALSYQTLSRLRSRFGQVCAVLHSGLPGSVRLREYLRIYDGEAKIAVGPRSALFAPFTDIGLIIIDEENESAYKSEESPRFHARTAAQYLAQKKNAVLLLGSATPSVESWYHAKGSLFRLYTLNERYGGAELPDIELIDTSRLGMKKNLSLPLTGEINRRLQEKEQIVLLQNRRGFANFVKCTSCGKVLACPRCDISLTYHRSKDRLICHHCGHSLALPGKCPQCKEEALVKFGAGTQRIEEEISAAFPSAKVQRMDHDSLKSEKDLSDLFRRIEKGDIDILVGTQMIAKGLHFPRIKFVGIVNADIILNIPDFKAAERTFALITQVAGRAGREGKKGYVMIQTMNPDNYSMTSAKSGDYGSFYEKEIAFRKMLDMPPFCRLLRLVVRGKTEAKIASDAAKLAGALKEKNAAGVTVLGPAPCMLGKINNNYRYQILLKGKKIGPLQELVKKTLPDIPVSSKNHLEIDVDPISLF